MIDKAKKMALKDDKKVKQERKVILSPNGEMSPCIKKMYEGVAATVRDKAASELAKYFQSKALPKKAIYDLLIAWNKKNKPPLSEKHIGGIVKESLKGSLQIDCDDAIVKKFCDLNCAFIENQGMENVMRDLHEITPAQDFKLGKAYTTVPLTLLGAGGKPSTNYFLISSDRKKIKLTSANLLSEKFYTYRWPNVEPRWSINSMESFLRGNAKSNIVRTYKEITELIGGHIDLGDKKWNSVFACWIIGTYFHRMFEAYPYLHLSGNMSSGKTKTLMIMSALAFNAEHTVNSSIAYITGNIHANHSTCCIDEAEKIKPGMDQDRQTLISMYNSGYKKGVKVCKMEPMKNEDGWKPVKLEAYSPKIFAGIKAIDATLASRCIPITMMMSDNDAIKNKDVKTQDPIYQRLRDELYLIMMSDYKEVEKIYQVITDSEIVGREWEIWKSIFTIAKIIDIQGESISDNIRGIALEVQKQKKEIFIEDMTAPKILQLLLDMLAEDGVTNALNTNSEKNWYTATDIISHLASSGEETFKWLSDEKKQYKSRWLGNELRKAGAINERAKVKKFERRNVRAYYLDPERIKSRLKALGIKYEPLIPINEFFGQVNSDDKDSNEKSSKEAIPDEIISDETKATRQMLDETFKP